MIDPAELAAAAAPRLQVDAADLVQPATSALEYIAWDISTTVDTLDPDSALLFTGARLLTERIYQDVPTSTGELDPIGTVEMGGLLVPENLGRHLRHYWAPQQEAWGVA